MKYILSFLLLCCFPLLLFSQWVQLGPSGGDIEVMERVGGNIWVGTDYGVYISDDEGESWLWEERFGRGRYILLERVNSAIYIHGTYIAPGQTDGQLGLYRSEDEGANWTLVSNNVGIGATFLPDMVDILECGDKAFFRSSSAIFVCTIGQWDWQIDTVSALQQFSTIRQDQSTLVVSGATLISVSTDCGETWIDKPSDQIATYAQYVKGDTLIGPQRSFGEWAISYDLGDSWVQQQSVGIYFQDKIIQLADGSYVEFGLGFFHAQNVSGPWEGIPASEDYGFLEDALLLSNGEILVCGEEGLFRVNLDRDEMIIDFSGPPIHLIKSILASSDGMYVASSELTTYQSQDGGGVWGQMFLPKDPQNIGNVQSITGAGWIGRDFFVLSNGIVAKQSPPYVHYDQVSPSPAGGPHFDLVVANERVFVASDDGFWRGTQAGDDFESYPLDSVPAGVVSMHQAGDYVYFYRRGDWFRYLTDDAASIDQLNWQNTDYRFVDDIIFRCEPTQWSVSNDDGATWMDLNMATSGIPTDATGDWSAPNAIVSMNDSLFLTPSFKKGVYVSADGGFTWESRTFNLEGETILSLASDPFRRGLVASIPGKSLFGYFPEGFSDSDELPEFVNEILAYPNPASSTVQLSFTNDLPREARFSLFSSNGQQLSPYIVNRSNKKALLVVEHLPEGLYYVAAQVGKEVITTPIVVAR